MSLNIIMVNIAVIIFSINVILINRSVYLMRKRLIEMQLDFIEVEANNRFINSFLFKTMETKEPNEDQFDPKDIK